MLQVSHVLQFMLNELNNILFINNIVCLIFYRLCEYNRNGAEFQVYLFVLN